MPKTAVPMKGMATFIQVSVPKESVLRMAQFRTGVSRLCVTRKTEAITHVLRTADPTVE